jgi:hypothetical protein
MPVLNPQHNTSRLADASRRSTQEDSVAVVQALWQAGVRVPLSVEVFNAE